MGAETETLVELAGSVAPSLESTQCQGCGFSGSDDPHGCPYAAEITGNEREDYCNCCDGCRQQCAEDI